MNVQGALAVVRVLVVTGPAGVTLHWNESVAEGKRAGQVAGWFPQLWDAPEKKYANDRTDRYKNHEYARDLSNYSLLRRIYSTRTVFESMVEVWSNHLHVESRHFPGFTQRAAYDDVIRLAADASAARGQAQEQ